jgi:acyl-CoA hydrolase/GNAT superfamily N-acetyltransferase
MHTPLCKLEKKYPHKFVSEERIFSNIRRGDRIFVGTGCGQPQYLIRTLTDYVKNRPKAFFDVEVLQVWTMGVAPFLNDRFKNNFRLNSFFIGKDIRDAVNKNLADYTPVFLSKVPELFKRKSIPIDVALIQASLPDRRGCFSLGISVDIVKAAVESADLVVAQINTYMPYVHGDTLVEIENIDYIVQYDEPLIEMDYGSSDEAIQKIGNYVARIIRHGDTLQVGYGRMRNAILSHLKDKKHLGIHTELLSDGVVDLMKLGVVDNSRKSIDRGKTVASFCMGKKQSYEFLRNNPEIEFRPVDYTNNPTIISRIQNMVAINTALEIDLTGQATAESVGSAFFSGIGGQADFMRGAALAPGGKTILVLKSTAGEGSVSTIMPVLSLGSGVTLTRGDVHYVVTEFGIAYIHGKNIRERAMSLIAIAHPKFRPWLIAEAKKRHLIFEDQKFNLGKAGEYPEHLETYRTTKKGLNLLLRPVKISDEPLMKDFFYDLSDKSMYRRFFSARLDMHHETLQRFVIIDYTREMGILAVMEDGGQEIVVGYGQYIMKEDTHTAEVAFAVRDEYHRKGIATELIAYLMVLAKKQGLMGFTAAILENNGPALALMDKIEGEIHKVFKDGAYDFHVSFDQSRS